MTQARSRKHKTVRVISVRCLRDGRGLTPVVVGSSIGGWSPSAAADGDGRLALPRVELRGRHQRSVATAAAKRSGGYAVQARHPARRRQRGVGAARRQPADRRRWLGRERASRRRGGRAAGRTTRRCSAGRRRRRRRERRRVAGGGRRCPPAAAAAGAACRQCCRRRPSRRPPPPPGCRRSACRASASRSADCVDGQRVGRRRSRRPST